MLQNKIYCCSTAWGQVFYGFSCFLTLLLSFLFILFAYFFVLSKWISQFAVNHLNSKQIWIKPCVNFRYRFSLLICSTGIFTKKNKGKVFFTSSFCVMQVTAKIKGWMWCDLSHISQTFTSSYLANSCSNISERGFCYSFCTFDKNNVVWWTTCLYHHSIKFIIHQQNEYKNPGIYFGS